MMQLAAFSTFWTIISSRKVNKLPESERSAISDDVTQLRRMREAYKNHDIGI